MFESLARLLILHPCTYFIIALVCHTFLGWTVFPFN